MSTNAKGPSSQSIRLHDLLTPLNHIVGFTDLLLEELDQSSKEDIRADVEKIRKAADRMLEAIQRDPVPYIEIPAPGNLHAEHVGEPTSGSILVVDDDDNNRILVVRNLMKRGYEVAEAIDGVEALDQIRKNSFDLILCDIVMPRMDGVELLKHIQAEFADKLPVVVISAVDEMETVEQCLDLDAVDYITKPFEPYILLAKVRAILRRKRKRNEITQASAY